MQTYSFAKITVRPFLKLSDVNDPYIFGETKHVISMCDYREPEVIQRVPWRGGGCADLITEGGWIRYTWDGCCAIRNCTIEFIDKENSIQMLLGAAKRSDINEDSCVLGHYYYANGKQVLDFKHGLFPFQFEDELIVVPQYRGGIFLQEKYGKGSFYAARIKNSQYPKLDFPKDEFLEYNPENDKLEFYTADTSSVVVRAWQLPDSTGYLYYVAHQDYYTEMVPTWTTLIYSPTSLTKKFIHKNYKVDHFSPTDKRY